MPTYRQAQKRWRLKSGHGGEPMEKEPEKEPIKEPYVTPEVTSEEVAPGALASSGSCGCGGG
jgi:hypothetical protein